MQGQGYRLKSNVLFITFWLHGRLKSVDVFFYIWSVTLTLRATTLYAYIKRRQIYIWHLCVTLTLGVVTWMLRSTHHLSIFQQFKSYIAKVVWMGELTDGGHSFWISSAQWVWQRGIKKLQLNKTFTRIFLI